MTEQKNRFTFFTFDSVLVCMCSFYESFYACLFFFWCLYCVHFIKKFGYSKNSSNIGASVVQSQLLTYMRGATVGLGRFDVSVSK